MSIDELPVASSPQRIDKPWGFELIFAHTDAYAGKILCVKKGHRLSHQYHQNKDESIYIQDGEIQIQLSTSGEEHTSIVLRSGECLRIRPLTRHRMLAIRDTIIFEVSTHQLGDVVRIEDDYGRAD